MPEGRMLKKVISTSLKVAKLKSDSARLLYTWLIPHLDIDGRFSADPDIVKGYIVPRLKMSSRKIAEYLEDMADNELIVLYEIDGDKFLQLNKFKKFQLLNPKREAKSLIPSPKEQKIKKRCFTKKEYDYAWGEWEKNGKICPICKKKGKFVTGKGIVIDGYIPFQIDHIIPLSKGGTYDLENLRVVCQKCNATKANKITPEFIKISSSISKVKESKVKESKVKVKKEQIEEIINYLNKKTKKNFRSTTVKTISLIKARFNEKFNVDDFKKVIDVKTKQWLNKEEFSGFLRPLTLFGNKFESYLNESKEIKLKKPKYFKAEEDEKSTPMPSDFINGIKKDLEKIEEKKKAFDG